MRVEQRQRSVNNDRNNIEGVPVVLPVIWGNTGVEEDQEKTKLTSGGALQVT